MVSKCLNPRCSARFRYLGEGRLFRIDFSEAGRRRKALAGEPLPELDRDPIEHFWLCAGCAPRMTIHLTDAGEVRLVSTERPARKNVASDQDYSYAERAS